MLKDEELIYETSRTTQLDDVVHQLARGKITGKEAVRRLRMHLAASRQPMTWKKRWDALVTVVRWQNERQTQK
jgi:hypothetical protein